MRTPTLEIAYHESGPAEWSAGDPAAWLAFRSARLGRRRAATCRRRMPCPGAVAARLRRRRASSIQRRRGPASRRHSVRMCATSWMHSASSEALLVGYDWGGRGACVCAALWPERVRGLVSINGYNIQNIPTAGRPGAAAQEHRHWYQWYFHTERGRAGLQENRRDIARLLWRLWSPNWQFDDATFEATASSFDNADFVDVTIQSYRHRYGNAPGDPALEPLEQRLAERRRSPCRRSCCMAPATGSVRRSSPRTMPGISPAAMSGGWFRWPAISCRARRRMRWCRQCATCLPSGCAQRAGGTA